MRIVIFGANGPTGRLLTRLSLTAGYNTVAVTRQPGTFPLQDPDNPGLLSMMLREAFGK